MIFLWKAYLGKEKDKIPFIIFLTIFIHTRNTCMAAGEPLLTSLQTSLEISKNDRKQPNLDSVSIKF